MKWWILLFILSLPMAIMSGLQIIMPLLEGVPLSSIGWNPIPLLFTILFLVLAIRSVKDKATNKNKCSDCGGKLHWESKVDESWIRWRCEACKKAWDRRF